MCLNIYLNNISKYISWLRLFPKTAGRLNFIYKTEDWREAEKKTNIYNKRESKTLNNTFVVYYLVNYYWLVVIDWLPIGSKSKLSLEDS